jgi:hypothetical protein
MMTGGRRDDEQLAERSTQQNLLVLHIILVLLCGPPSFVCRSRSGVDDQYKLLVLLSTS